jgi:hypothetical protein
LTINGLDVYQYLLTSPATANYKLLGETSPENRFLIEYVVRGDMLETLHLALESSIATIKSGAAPR